MENGFEMMNKSLIGKFAKNKKGNIALLTSFLAIPMFVLAGGAVDLMRIAGARSEVLGAIDTGVLAATSLTNTRDPETVIREYVDTNVDPSIIDPANVTLNVSSTKTLNSSTINVTADFSIPTTFLSLLGYNSVPVQIASTGTEAIPNVEVSLVLDVSGSMRGDKIVALRDAANEFIDTIITPGSEDRVSVSLIPYSSNVQLNKTTFGAYLDVEEILCEGQGGSCDIDDFSEAEIQDAINNDWNGCFNYDNADYGTGLLQSTSEEETPRDRDCKPSQTPIFVSNDTTALHAQINSYTASGSTAMHVGTMWGLKALSPSWQGAIGAGPDFGDRPKAFTDEDTQKFLVVMTDGQINPIRSDNFGSDAIAGNHFTSVCQQARDNNVSVWAIGFQITDGSDADILLEQCPSNPSQYFLIEGLNISDAFEVIAATINNLRITS